MHVAPCFEVLLRCVCCIVFDVYRTCALHVNLCTLLMTTELVAVDCNFSLFVTSKR